MYSHLVTTDETLYTVVNAFRPEIERMNQAKNLEELKNLQETAVDDASKMDADIERYFD